MIELDVRISASELYDYMLMHTYHSASGILGNGVGAVCVVGGAMSGQWIFTILGVILLLYLPWTLFLKSKQQVLANPGFQKPLHYCLDENGITVSQDEVSESQGWDQMVKAVSTGRSIIVYTSRVNATIFPKAQLGEQKDAVIGMISTHMPPGKVNIRN